MSTKKLIIGLTEHTGSQRTNDSSTEWQTDVSEGASSKFAQVSSLLLTLAVQIIMEFSVQVNIS